MRLHAKLNQQKPNESLRFFSFYVHVCPSSVFFVWDKAVIGRHRRVAKQTDLSSDEVELGVTLHTSRALEDGEEEKQDVTQRAELDGFKFNSSSGGGK